MESCGGDVETHIFLSFFCGRPRPPWRKKLLRWFLQSKKQHHHHGVVLQWRSGHSCAAKSCWSPQQRGWNGLYHLPPRRRPEPLRRVLRRSKVHLSEGPPQSFDASDHGDDCSPSSRSNDAATIIDARPSTTTATARSSSSRRSFFHSCLLHACPCPRLRLLL